MPAQEQRINALTTGERDLLHLVCTRLLCALEEPFVYEETAACWYAVRMNLGRRAGGLPGWDGRAFGTPSAEALADG